MVRKLTAFCLIAFVLVMNGCSVITKKEKAFFEMKNASYQSWIVSENEKGTNISIELTNIQHGVTFDSIVFRGNRLPLTTNTYGDTVILTSRLNVGIERLSLDKQSVNLSDRLMYRYNDKKYSLPIKSFTRKETKYLK